MVVREDETVICLRATSQPARCELVRASHEPCVSRRHRSLVPTGDGGVLSPIPKPTAAKLARSTSRCPPRSPGATCDAGNMCGRAHGWISLVRCCKNSELVPTQASVMPSCVHAAAAACTQARQAAHPVSSQPDAEISRNSLLSSGSTATRSRAFATRPRYSNSSVFTKRYSRLVINCTVLEQPG